jgi:hypothetical protein
VGRFEVDRGTFGDDARRVHRLLTAIVVLLDVIEVHGLGDSGHLVELSRVPPEVREIDEPIPIALEVPVVHGVEAHERGEEAPVRLGDLIPDEVAAAPEALLELVERGEELVVRMLVGFLRGREACLVDAVVHAVVDEIVHSIDLGP